MKTDLITCTVQEAFSIQNLKDVVLLTLPI